MNKEETTHGALLPDFSSRSARRHRQWRGIKDVATRYLMAFGGVSVIIAIVLIAFYLLYVVIPMFKPATVEPVAAYPTPGDARAATLLYALEEQRELGLRVTDAGRVIFFNAATGAIRKTIDLALPGGVSITSAAAGDPAQRMVGLGLSDGRVLLFRHDYAVSYPNDARLITPDILFPFGRAPLPVIADQSAVSHLAVQYDDEQAAIAAHDGRGGITLLALVRETTLFGDDFEIIREQARIILDTAAVSGLRVDVEQRELYVAADPGHIYFYNIADKPRPQLVQKIAAVDEGAAITAIEFLAGGISLLVGDSSGQIAQWFPVRDDNNNYTLERIRAFNQQQAPITAIAPEHARKGFAALDASGRMGLYHTTAHRNVWLGGAEGGVARAMALAPRANAALIETDQDKLQFWRLDNEHPEISFRSIWGKVWYESRQGPEYIWQSSSASSDFEPKFSLTPLAFGTLKAAFYAMLFAIPLAIMGAIYTAYFMAPRMRQVVKPTIEIMEALPTVILGFLAGLWLAPFVELHLPGMFIMLLLVPVSIVVAAAGWAGLPAAVKYKIPAGWEAALLIPVIILAVVASIQISQPVERLLFDGNMPLWLSQEMGINYDQRNSLVVGLAMGFAVIPTIFSISEDAVYSVPKHLTTGSLALGATTWQTMVRVILLTASPGIFSAVMIGLGRAVGETMIVVMATGNTAIMDMNIFEGFRAMSANIAVEMPETEVNSTHYRILFLGALVLFMITFLFNTIAEIVRQRLRKKYSSL